MFIVDISVICTCHRRQSRCLLCWCTADRPPGCRPAHSSSSLLLVTPQWAQPHVVLCPATLQGERISIQASISLCRDGGKSARQKIGLSDDLTWATRGHLHSLDTRDEATRHLPVLGIQIIILFLFMCCYACQLVDLWGEASRERGTGASPALPRTAHNQLLAGRGRARGEGEAGGWGGGMFG